MKNLFDIIRLTQKKAWPVENLCLRLGLSDKELRSVVKEGQKEGFTVRIRGGMVTSKSPSLVEYNHPVVGDMRPGRKHVAIMTDTHFGSAHCDVNGIKRFLKLAADKGCRVVICTGDILDGCGDKILHDQDHPGIDKQIDLAVKTISQAPPLQYVAIDGNHDGYFSKIGIISGVILAERMKEAGVKWDFTGVCLGRATIHGAKFHMWHPHGGASTRNAIRRVLNERIESLEEKCDVLAIGHFHKYVGLPTYPEGVYGVAGGTFQKKISEFANRLSRGWDVGGTIVSYTLHKDGTVGEFSSEFYPSTQK